MKNLKALLVFAAVIGGVSTPGSAQEALPRGISLAGSVGAVRVTGPDHRGLAASPSFEASIRYSSPWRVQLHGIAHYSRYPIGGTREKLNLVSFLLEPRVEVMPRTSPVVPFLGFRVGRIWENLQARGADLANFGRSVGASIGVEFMVAQQAGLEFGASADWMTFGEFEVDGSTAWASCLANQVPVGSTMVSTIQTCVPFVNRVLAQVGSGPGGTRVSIPQPGSETTGSRQSLYARLTVYLSAR